MCIYMYRHICIDARAHTHTHGGGKASSTNAAEKKKYGKEQNQLSMSYYPAQKAITNK